MRPILIGALSALVVVVGGVAIAAIVSSSGATTAEEEIEEPLDFEESPLEDGEAAFPESVTDVINEILDGLVESGVMTPAEVEDLREALEDLPGDLRERLEDLRSELPEDFEFELPDVGGLPEGFFEGEGFNDLRSLFGQGLFGSPLEAAAETIGIPLRQLLNELADGLSILEIAEAEGADADEVVEAMVDSVVGSDDDLPAGVRSAIESAMRALAEGRGGLFGFGPGGPGFRFFFDFDQELEGSNA
ncbi:MAG: hypothetical protein ACE5MI_03680 [Acidimicrobiia bacterium]